METRNTHGPSVYDYSKCGLVIIKYIKCYSLMLNILYLAKICICMHSPIHVCIVLGKKT